MSDSIENVIVSLRNYRAEGLKLIAELSQSDVSEAFHEKEEKLLDRFVSLWQECDQKMSSADFQSWGGHHPLYSELKNQIEQVTDILSSIVASLETKKITIQKILEDLPPPMRIVEERTSSIFEASV
ncbi:MAG: hypothetical protein IPJ69_02920 [Deltaproteobacteria bacterium]|nr:MAG: hypothetical protein IPJ69_02920 [Deltaproteobacteria bacterium]